MKRGKMTVECSCGNQKKWAILADMVELRQDSWQRVYKLECNDCGATRIIFVDPIPFGRL